MVGQFTRRQWLTLIVISIADFANAICISLQAPFYPLEAERKGASPSEYGLVFGIFELIVFLISPIYGQNLNKIGPKLLFNGGILTTGTCAIFFGLLDKVDGHYPFIILSFIIRIVEAIGNAAFLTASFAIIAKEFPDNIATTFASLETFFGLGLIVGPTVGGALYQVGGYVTPFAVLGSALILAAIMTIFVLPIHEQLDPDSQTQTFAKVLRIPSILVATGSITATSISIGFLQATLEPLLRQFELSPVILGLMFVINGGVYAITTPFWGWLCDHRIQPKICTVAGCLFIVIGFSLIGPAPFIPSKTNIILTICGLVLHGFGISAHLVAAFTDALATTISYGFPNNFDTYGLISALWTSSFALGAFIGPSIGGFLLEQVGFSYGSVFIIILHLLLGILATFFLNCCSRDPKPYTEIERTENLGRSMTDSGRVQSVSSSVQQSHQNVTIDRPIGMNSLILCNSYSQRASHYSQSYGSIDAKRYLLERTT